MLQDTTPDVHNSGASNPALSEETMNILPSNTEIKTRQTGDPGPDAEGCGSVADGVADDVAADPTAKSLTTNDVADVADEPGEPEGALLLDTIAAAIRQHVALGAGLAE